jgi:hypothetical protein
MRQCEKNQNQTSFNEVFKTHVMMLNDLMIMFMSLFLILLDLKLFTTHN